ncbi:MAG: hemagglutinin protein [Acidimicrobiales bacterium]|jgi:hypothetical protein|nr:hemagglutinin protein [Acidimicrobiales bacterium]
MRLGARGRGTGLLVVAAVGVLLAATRPALGTGDARAGCSPSRIATAYDGHGNVLARQPGGAPVPCMTFTGFATQETHVVVTKDGTVVHEPAVITPGLAGTAFVPGAPGPHPWQPTSPAGIVVSRTGGKTWDFVKPAGSLWTGADAALYADPTTGRIFEETLSPGEIPSNSQIAPQDQTPGGHAYLLASPDSGRNWNATALTGFLFQENARFTSAPPVAGQSTTAGGYPNVTYWCGNRDVGLLEPLILERECYRSLDGGVTWQMRAILFTNPVPQHAECGANREDLNSLDGNYPQGAADGSLYVMVSCTSATSPTSHSGSTYLARSTDEAGTFPILHRAGTGAAVKLPVPSDADWPELRVARVGAADVLYLTYQANTPKGPAILLRTATVPRYVNGVTVAADFVWGPVVNLTPAGLLSIDRWAVSTRGSELAVSYIAQPTKGAYHGYVSVMRNAMATSPVIWTATVNDPHRPLMNGPPVSAKDDFIDVAIGPDGSPWASFFSPCSAEPALDAQRDPACRDTNANFEGGNDRGVVGRLLLAS